MKIQTIRYKLYTDRVQFSYLKTEIKKSRMMYEQACLFCKRKGAVTKQELWDWLKHYRQHYVKGIEDDELYVIWEQVQRYLINLQKGTQRKHFFKCEGMHTLKWRNFPLTACMKIDADWKREALLETRITRMKIWYEKHDVYVEISYRSYECVA